MQDDGPPPSDGFSKAFEACAQKPENANTDLEVGDELPADVLRELGVEGRRVAITFYFVDDGFTDIKQLSAFADRAADYQMMGCDLIAVRNPSRGRKVEGFAAKYPSFKIIDDEDDRLKSLLRMPYGSSSKRTTLMVDEDGEIVGSCTNQGDPFAHGQCAMSALRSLEKETPRTTIGISAGTVRPKPSQPGYNAKESEKAADAWAEQLQRMEDIKAGRVAPPPSKPLIDIEGAGFKMPEFEPWTPPWAKWAQEKRAKQVAEMEAKLNPEVVPSGAVVEDEQPKVEEPVAEAAVVEEKPPVIEVEEDPMAKIKALEAELESLKKIKELEAELERLKGDVGE